MVEDFVPSSSIDSRTRPMEVEMPLIEPPSNPETSNKTVQKLITKADPLINIQKKSENANEYYVRNNKASNVTHKLFNVTQLKSLSFYQALFSEFLGTMLLTLICTSTGLPIMSKSVPDLHGALASGFIVATIIVGFGHVSGAHINPAVTLTFLVASEIDFVRALFYIGMQLLGAISASAVVQSITPPHAQGNLGMTMITDGISLTQAFVVEFIITFILCYTVHAICDKNRDDVGGSKALAVGFTVTIACLFAGPYTGASMNPARSFGPATIMNKWDNHWIYWLGPLAGSITAALIYTYVLKKSKPDVVTQNDSNYNNKNSKV